MPAHLAPCPSCRRHVRVTETACPFCSASLPDSFRATPPPRRPKRRLGRAATFAFRASLAGASAATVACGAQSTGDDIEDPGGADYGTAPEDSGVGPEDDAGIVVDAGTGEDGGVAAMYGVTPEDGGAAEDDGGMSADYGAAPPRETPPKE